MTNYRIRYDKNAFGYNVNNDDIFFAIHKYKNTLSDNELSDFVADSLLHEHIHKLLFELFDETTSRLFDGIQQHFRNIVTHEKLLNDTFGQETYHKYIERLGYQAFLNYYNIDNDKFNQSYIICNNKSFKGVIN